MNAILAIKMLMPASFSISASMAPSCQQPCLFNQDLYCSLLSSNFLLSQIPINLDGEERHQLNFNLIICFSGSILKRWHYDGLCNIIKGQCACWDLTPTDSSPIVEPGWAEGLSPRSRWWRWLFIEVVEREGPSAVKGITHLLSESWQEGHQRSTRLLLRNKLSRQGPGVSRGWVDWWGLCGKAD